MFQRARSARSFFLKNGFLLLLVGLAGCGRTTFQALRSPDHLTTQLGRAWLKSYREQPQLHEVTLVDVAGHRRRLPADSVWGYRSDRGRTFRLYEHSLYEVVQQASLTIYRQDSWNDEVSWQFYYFSLTPDGPLYPLDKRTCRRVFRDDACFLSLLDQLRAGELLRTDSRGSFGLVNAYEYCHTARQARR